MKKIISAILLAALLLLSLCSCKEENPAPKSRIFYEYFDTVGAFYDHTGSSDEDFSALADRVEEELSEYHKLYDIYNEYDGLNNLATVNKSAGEGPVKVDKKIIDMLLYAKEMYDLTDGNINVAMGSVLSIWHECREEGVRIPTEEELSEASKHTDIDNIVINSDDLTVELTDSEMSVDVGAVGKGYAVEMIAKTLHGEGYSGYILDVGGNIRAIGTKMNGDGFKTGVRNPDRVSSESYLHYFYLKNEAAVTSGSYERFYTVGGVNYHHIIDKDTLMPKNIYVSVSVVSPSSALSDCLSTAFFNMEEDEIKSVVEKLDGVEVFILRSDGETTLLSN